MRYVFVVVSNWRLRFCCPIQFAICTMRLTLFAIRTMKDEQHLQWFIEMLQHSFSLMRTSRNVVDKREKWLSTLKSFLDFYFISLVFFFQQFYCHLNWLFKLFRRKLNASQFHVEGPRHAVIIPKMQMNFNLTFSFLVSSRRPRKSSKCVLIQQLIFLSHKACFI